MNAIHHVTNSPFDGSSSSNRDLRDATNAGLFGEMLDTMTTRVDELADAQVRSDDHRDDDVDDDRPESAETADSGNTKTPNDRAGEHRKHGDATAVHVPFGLTTEKKGGERTVVQQVAATGTDKPKPGSASSFNVDAPAETPTPESRQKLHAQVSQTRQSVQSRPLIALSAGLATDEANGAVQTGRDGARLAADKKFAAGETAIEKLASRKAALHDATSTQSANGDAAQGKRATFAERMADLADRLAQRVPGHDAPQTQQARTLPVSLPAQANALHAAMPAARAGDLPFTLPAADGSVDTVQAAAQAAANRVLHSASAASHTASRTPQAPAGTPAEQVSVQIQTGLRNDSDRINVRLYPAALGKVEVKLEVSHDKAVHAIVTAEKPETLDMLARDARILQRALEQAGLQTDANSLSFQQGNGGGAAQQFAGHSGHSAETFGGGATSETAGDPTLSEQPQQSRRAAHDGVLDVEI